MATSQDIFLRQRDPELVPSSHGLTWSLQRQTTERHELGYTVQKSTYLSPKMSLAPGEMVFTRLHDTILKMPEGRYAILNFSGEVVDAQERSVPLDTVYNHHWIVRTLKVNPHVNRLCQGAMNFNFGIGAESRLRPTAIPAGFGYSVEDGEVWGANIHLLHTVNLTGSAKECNECWYAPNKGPRCSKSKNGTFDCCGELCSPGECKCPTVEGAPTKASDYYLRYEVHWTPDVDKVVPVEIGSLAAPNCKEEYDVLRNNRNPEQVASYSWTSPVGTQIVLAQGHLHTGSLNISLFKNNEFVCASFPRYGSQVGVAGDELGHLVDVSPCLNETTGFMNISKGETLRVDAWYYTGDDDDRLLPGEAGSHLGVMAYMEMYYIDDLPGPDVAKCQAQLKADGCPLASGSPCLKCGKAHSADLRKATCTETLVRSLCAPA
jgi:hypothetical protein